MYSMRLPFRRHREMGEADSVNDLRLRLCEQHGHGFVDRHSTG